MIRWAGNNTAKQGGAGVIDRGRNVNEVPNVVSASQVPPYASSGAAGPTRKGGTMNRFRLLIAAGLAAAACGSSSSDNSSGFTGTWNGGGEGELAFETGLSVNPGGVNSVLSFSTLRFTSDEPNVVRVDGLYPPSSIVGSIPMQVLDPSTLAVHSYSSAPVTVACSDPGCDSPTDSVTIFDGSGRIESGLLLLTLTGQRTLCCTKEAFVEHFLGARP